MWGECMMDDRAFDLEVIELDRPTWSLYLGLVGVLGAVVLAALPTTRPLGELGPPGRGADLASFFAGTLIIAYGVVALNLGTGIEMARGRARPHLHPYPYLYLYLELLLKLLLGLAVTAPFWAIFQGFYFASLGALLLGGVYTLGYGLVLGLYGLGLRTVGSEAGRFLLKYLGLTAYLVGTLPLVGMGGPARAVNPLYSLMAILQERLQLVEYGVGFLALGALGGLAALFANRRLRGWRARLKDTF